MSLAPFTRRRFLRTLGQGTLLAALPGPVFAATDDTVMISVLHTTDLHGHILPTVDYDNNPDLGGLARCAAQIRQWRQANPNSVLLDIGDVYQGTAAGLQDRGATMIRCLNALHYDAWVVGNHEFDWGMGPFRENLRLSSMPVLSGNCLVEGKPVGTLSAADDPLARLQPMLVKEVAGIRLVIIGLTTPGLTSWLPPESLDGFEVLEPVEVLRSLLRRAKELKPEAILLAGHMGLTRMDDYANRVGTLTKEFPQLAVFLGGHTHINHPGEPIHNVLYTQADHYGIYAGKLDLTFDRATRKLIGREATTVHMDNRVALDPLVLSVAQADLDASAQVLARPIGEVTEPLSITSSPGKPGDVERLIGSCIRAALRKKNVEIDVVIHGLFDAHRNITPGPKTVADAWTIIPYENRIVTIELSREDLLAVAREVTSGADTRQVMGVVLEGAMQDKAFRLTGLRGASGPLPDKPAYRVALNVHDSQSGGQRFPILARLTARPSSRRMLYDIMTRDALIDFFLDRGKVSRASLII